MGKGNNKTNVEFTEIELKKLINYMIHYDITGENEGYKSSILKEIFTDISYNNNAWWEIKKKDNKYYDQKAHIIMRILAKSNKKNIKDLIGTVSNNGFCCLLHYCINNGEYKEKSNKKQPLSKWWSDYEEDIKNFLEREKNIEQEININILLDYLKLNFSCIKNFNDIGDFENYSKPILDNLYDWYLNDIETDKIQECCDCLDKVINEMKKLLLIDKYFNNNTKKYNLICTICYTKIIINKLKKELDLSKETAITLENDNDLLQKIIDSLRITEQVCI